MAERPDRSRHSRKKTRHSRQSYPRLLLCNWPLSDPFLHLLVVDHSTGTNTLQPPGHHSVKGQLPHDFFIRGTIRLDFHSSRTLCRGHGVFLQSNWTGTQHCYIAASNSSRYRAVPPSLGRVPGANTATINASSGTPSHSDHSFAPRVGPQPLALQRPFQHGVGSQFPSAKAAREQFRVVKTAKCS